MSSDVKGKVIAEVSVVPLGVGVSLSKYVAEAVRAIEGFRELRCMVTPMGTIVEAEDLGTVFRAVEAAHETLRRMGVVRILTTVKIDERMDRSRKMEDKVEAVFKRLKQ